MKSKSNIILKMPKNITTYYFIGMIISIVIGFLLINGSSIKLQNVGISVVGGVIVGSLAFAGTLISRSNEEDENLLQIVRELGITGYTEERSMKNEEYKIIASNTENYDLIGFGLGRFRKDMRLDFDQWIKDKKMRILVINPNSDISAQRDREELDNVGKISQEVIEITKDFLNLTFQYKIKTPILKWYNAIPSMNIQRFDSVMYIGPYFVGKTSKKSIALRLEDNSILYNSFKEHFDEMWKNEELSFDPSYVEKYPALLTIPKRYWDNNVYFLTGATCSGKTTVLEVAKDLNYIVVDWSSVLRDYFLKQETNEYTNEDVINKVKEKGIHFFPLKVMDKIIREYVNKKGNTSGIVIAGARNLYELFYLSTFFDSSKSKIVMILASDKVRYSRFCKDREMINLSKFLYNDDSCIIESLNEKFIEFKKIQIITLDNDEITLSDYNKKIIEIFKN